MVLTTSLHTFSISHFLSLFLLNYFNLFPSPLPFTLYQSLKVSLRPYSNHRSSIRFQDLAKSFFLWNFRGQPSLFPLPSLCLSSIGLWPFPFTLSSHFLPSKVRGKASSQPPVVWGPTSKDSSFSSSPFSLLPSPFSLSLFSLQNLAKCRMLQLLGVTLPLYLWFL